VLIQSLPKFFFFFERALDENLTGTAVAKEMGLTKQRISQIKNEVVKTIKEKTEIDVRWNQSTHG
jgi:DNA-directed RNA polymerase specialized sigma subunit